MSASTLISLGIGSPAGITAFILDGLYPGQTIDAEPISIRVAAEDRSIVVAAESRAIVVPSDDRSIVVPSPTPQ